MAVETTKTVGEWADATFGVGSVRGRSLRLLEEAYELCFAAGAADDEVDMVGLRAVADRHRKATWYDPGKIPEEIADCAIVLHTIAHTCAVDLESEVDLKMRVNRDRKWRLTGDGCGQHEEETA